MAGRPRPAAHGCPAISSEARTGRRRRFRVANETRATNGGGGSVTAGRAGANSTGIRANSGKRYGAKARTADDVGHGNDDALGRSAARYRRAGSYHTVRYQRVRDGKGKFTRTSLSPWRLGRDGRRRRRRRPHARTVRANVLNFPAVVSTNQNTKRLGRLLLPAQTNVVNRDCVVLFTRPAESSANSCPGVTHGCFTTVLPSVRTRPPVERAIFLRADRRGAQQYVRRPLRHDRPAIVHDGKTVHGGDRDYFYCRRSRPRSVILTFGRIFRTVSGKPNELAATNGRLRQPTGGLVR